MNCTKIVASIGLIFDVTGALLVAKDYWFPQVTSEHERDNNMFDTSAQAKRIQEQAKNYPYARWGLVLLIIGFIIQFIAQWV